MTEDQVKSAETQGDSKLDIQEFGAAALNVFESIRFAVETVDTKLNKVATGSKLVKTMQTATDDHVCILAQYASVLAVIIGLTNAALAVLMISIEANTALVLVFSALALFSMMIGVIGARYACTHLQARRWTDGDNS